MNIATASIAPLLLLGTSTLAQELRLTDTRTEAFAAALGFEGGSGDSLPQPWSFEGQVELDHDIVHSGDSAARFTLGESIDDVASLDLIIPIDFAGDTVDIRAYLRTENASRRASPFGSETDPDSPLVDPIEGTSDWTEYSQTYSINPNAHTISVNVNFAGAGVVWVDDVQILVDGRPLSEIPRVETLTDQRIAELIDLAKRAGPASVADDATIKTVYGGMIRELRAGSNGWTCWAETQGLGPMCNEPDWDAWLMAYWSDDDTFSVDRLSTSYMLAGAGEAPHIMLLAPRPILDRMTTDNGNAVWAMWTGGPFAHVMLNMGPRPSLEELNAQRAAGSFPGASTQNLALPFYPYIPFEPIAMSAAELQRYAGTYGSVDTPESLPFLAGVTITARVDGDQLSLQWSVFPEPLAFLPASPTRFISGSDEIMFELNDDGEVLRFTQVGPSPTGDVIVTWERIE